MITNILSVYNAASAYELKEGQEWYTADAWAFCCDYGWKLAAHFGMLNVEISSRYFAKFVAAVVAILSPQKEWRVNKALAAAAVECLITQKPVTGHYGKQCEKVHKLWQYYAAAGSDVDTDHILNLISKPDAKKTRNFYLNIIGNHNVVTVDGHAASIANNGLHRVAITEAKQPSGKAYDVVAAAYTDAAVQLGIAPAVLQAVVWITYRRLALVTK